MFLNINQLLEQRYGAIIYRKSAVLPYYLDKEITVALVNLLISI
jgi:hypothetical protein